MPRLLRLPLTLLAALAMVLSACGDDEDDPTPGLLDDSAPDATVSNDSEGAVGEPPEEAEDLTDRGNEDSQTNTTFGGNDSVMPTSNEFRVNGPFGDQDLFLLFDQESECAIDEEMAAAELTGSTSDGERFDLFWSTDASIFRSTLVVDDTTWTVDVSIDDNEVVELTANGEILLETSYESDAGELRDAQFLVNCQPEVE